MKTILFFALILSPLVFSGCVSPPGVSGNLGYSQERRVVVVGENVPQDIAEYYQRRYDAMVWFTPPEGVVKDSARVILKGFGPSKAMRSLINELESINYTDGRWEIIVPKTGEDYFLATLKNMPAGSMSHARGNMVLTDSRGDKEMEAQVARVSNDSFFVTYEFQKYQ